MRTLNNTGVTVPGGFRWYSEETKSWVPERGGDPSYVDFLYHCKLHCKANNLPIGAQWEAQIQDQICATLDGEWCLEGGYPVPPMGGWGFTIQAVIQGTRTLAQWMINGKGKRVDAAEAERRALICAGCPYNQPPVGCSGCNILALHEAANAVVNGAVTIYDSQLKSCKICGCSLRAKIHLPVDILRNNLTDGQMSSLPKHCWLL
jgi:hypothetical protein